MIGSVCCANCSVECLALRSFLSRTPPRQRPIVPRRASQWQSLSTHPALSDPLVEIRRGQDDGEDVLWCLGCQCPAHCGHTDGRRHRKALQRHAAAAAAAPVALLDTPAESTLHECQIFVKTSKNKIRALASGTIDNVMAKIQAKESIPPASSGGNLFGEGAAATGSPTSSGGGPFGALSSASSGGGLFGAPPASKRRPVCN